MQNIYGNEAEKLCALFRYSKGNSRRKQEALKMEEKQYTFPFGECHMHIFMNGRDYHAAVRAQSHGVNEQVIRDHFKEYRERGITWLRDGGDHYGTSKRAMEIAPEYGIT